MGIMVYSSLWVMQDLYHQPYPYCKEACAGSFEKIPALHSGSRAFESYHSTCFVPKALSKTLNPMSLIPETPVRESPNLSRVVAHICMHVSMYAGMYVGKEAGM